MNFIISLNEAITYIWHIFNTVNVHECDHNVYIYFNSKQHIIGDK